MSVLQGSECMFYAYLCEVMLYVYENLGCNYEVENYV
jgi:hypothetical protein